MSLNKFVNINNPSTNRWMEIHCEKLKVGELTFPEVDSTAGDVLTTDGNGNLSLTTGNLGIRANGYLYSEQSYSEDPIPIFPAFFEISKNKDAVEYLDNMGELDNGLVAIDSGIYDVNVGIQVIPSLATSAIFITILVNGIRILTNASDSTPANGPSDRVFLTCSDKLELIAGDVISIGMSTVTPAAVLMSLLGEFVPIVSHKKIYLVYIYTIMSLNHLTTTSRKKWMKIGAEQLKVAGVLFPLSHGIAAHDGAGYSIPVGTLPAYSPVSSLRDSGLVNDGVVLEPSGLKVESAGTYLINASITVVPSTTDADFRVRIAHDLQATGSTIAGGSVTAGQRVSFNLIDLVVLGADDIATITCADTAGNNYTISKWSMNLTRIA